MENALRRLIQSGLATYGESLGIPNLSNTEFELQITKDASHGDFATNIALKLSRELKQKPLAIANGLVESIQAQTANPIITKMEVAGPGFINFYLKKSALADVLLEVQRLDSRYGESEYGKKKKVMLEYVSANPTGPLTIAHGRQAAVGDSLARILKAAGYSVHREYYLNDAGRQMNLLGKSLWVRYCEEFQIPAELPEDGYRGEYMKDLAKRIVAEKRDELLALPEEEAFAICREYAKREMMKTIGSDLDKFNVSFDEYFSESTLYQKNAVDETLGFLKKKSYIFEQDGALWFRSTDFGDDKDRVVKKSTGEFTYLAPDIAYHRTKFDRGYEWLINFWGPDHHGYIARLKAACQALGHASDDIIVRIVQLTTLYRQGQPVRMSTRAGEFVTLQELIDEVGVDAARFFFIMRRIESPLDFDLDLAKQKSQDNPVYYLQYAHARICSISKFAQRKVSTQAALELLASQEETDLIKMISEFPKILVQSSQMLEPYRLADYLRDLAACFHRFYSVHRVVTEDAALTDARLLLVDSVRITLRNGLHLLGISQPETM